jgi:hypothetical protein
MRRRCECSISGESSGGSAEHKDTLRFPICIKPCARPDMQSGIAVALLAATPTKCYGLSGGFVVPRLQALDHDCELPNSGTKEGDCRQQE